MSKDVLLDKIKGGWAGQTIGCTYGGPTEFKYPGTMINDNISIEWPEHAIKYYYDNHPGLYDDIYMDLTWVSVFDSLGLDAPIEAHAKAFSTAKYPLWHANQQARYNLLMGIQPPDCGYWENNPHADDIDFQIEADYAGLMAPGMVNAAVSYTDEIGHLMNYGDGWYGGVYVAAMYALAFVYEDVNTVVKEALKTIPAESKFYRCMADVIKWHEQYPDNWEIAWARIQKDWSFDIGCPNLVYGQSNIDATVNCAYVLVGLLYGQGDFYKTIDISTRCGQDSDCNPATAGGILGVMMGYSGIPEYWKSRLYEVEDRNFAYTDISLNKAYQMSFDQAIQVIERNGGTVGENEVEIICQTPEPVRFEESFAGHWPVEKIQVRKDLEDAKLEFTGKGVVVNYSLMSGGKTVGYNDSDYVFEVEAYLDGELAETIKVPLKAIHARQDLFYKYNLEEKEHTLSFKLLNPSKDYSIRITTCLVYASQPKLIKHQ